MRMDSSGMETISYQDANSYHKNLGKYQAQQNMHRLSCINKAQKKTTDKGTGNHTWRPKPKKQRPVYRGSA